MATSAEWHEDYDKMSEATRNHSRAIKSVQEELEAVDWYHQRADQTSDPMLKKILEHNRDEENRARHNEPRMAPPNKPKV